MNWQDDGACSVRDVPLFFAAEGERQAEREIREAEARALCGSCLVRAKCLEYALRNSIRYGIWGGLNGEERSRERRRRTRRPYTAWQPGLRAPRS